MRKISLLLLVLFGIGLTTGIYALSLSDNPASKVVAPACNTRIVNGAACNVWICVYFNDCNLVGQMACFSLPAGSAVSVAAILVSMGYCCNGITGISTQVLPGGTPSAIIPPGGIDPAYMSGVPGPCAMLKLDYTAPMVYTIRP